jgi:hypothetical protein
MTAEAQRTLSNKSFPLRSPRLGGYYFFGWFHASLKIMAAEAQRMLSNKSFPLRSLRLCGYHFPVYPTPGFDSPVGKDCS